MHDDDSRTRLITELRKLEGSDPRHMSKDEQTSLLCWDVEQRLRDGEPAETKSNRRITSWVKTFLDVSSYVETHGALPRENNRVHQDSEEVRLAFWLRYQRRRRVAGDLCSYQQVSLDTLDGYSWAPVDDAWETNFVAYKKFLERERRVPRYRSTDLEEQRLAAWAAKQRHAFKQGRLDDTRVERLGTLPIRVLPTRRSPRSR